MRPTTRTHAIMVATALMLSTTACDRVTNASRSVQTVTMHAFNDTKSSWKDFFTYHPPQPDPLPQTRYCYQMQSDIVCYDSEQPTLTSRLFGYQDGETVSWVQPGGGSLGASGGEPITLRPAIPYPTNNVASNTTSTTMNGYYDVDTSPLPAATAKTVPSTQGQISVDRLPPLPSQKVK